MLLTVIIAAIISFIALILFFLSMDDDASDLPMVFISICLISFVVFLMALYHLGRKNGQIDLIHGVQDVKLIDQPDGSRKWQYSGKVFKTENQKINIEIKECLEKCLISVSSQEPDQPQSQENKPTQ